MMSKFLEMASIALEFDTLFVLSSIAVDIILRFFDVIMMSFSPKRC